jgi:hypothetical protein
LVQGFCIFHFEPGASTFVSILLSGRRITVARIAKIPREHFKRTVEDELAKFEREERAIRQADRDDRAAQLRLPIARSNSASPQNHKRS